MHGRELMIFFKYFYSRNLDVSTLEKYCDDNGMRLGKQYSGL